MTTNTSKRTWRKTALRATKIVGTLVQYAQRRRRRSNVNPLARMLASDAGVFRALAESSSDFICIGDERGRPLYINPAGLRMVGLAPDHPVETTRFGDYFPADMRAHAAKVMLRETREHGQWHGETSLRHWRTGGRIPVLAAHFLMHDRATGKATGMAMILREATAMRKTANELASENHRLLDSTHTLAERQRFLEAVLDHSPNGIIIKDLEGRYLLANNRIYQLLGRTPGGVTGRLDGDLFPRDTANRFRANDKTVIETAAPLTTEETVQTDEGMHVFLVNKFPLCDQQRRPFAVCAIWSDITKRKQAEEALRQAAADLRAAEHVAQVGSWTWDVASDTPQWSEELYRIFDRDPSLPVPRLLSSDAQILTVESLTSMRTAVRLLLSEGRAYSLELEFQRPDGSLRWIAAAAEPIRDEQNHITGIRGTARDITELRRLQRMREEWTSVIAHDLRQPISVIGAAADLLPDLHPGAMPEDERNITDRIRSAAHGLARMVNDLLDVSLLETKRLRLERTRVDPCVVVKEVVARLSYLTTNNPVVIAEDPEIPDVDADAMRVEQVLGNLISNAVRYGEKGAEIVVRLARSGSELEITVENHGRGISAEQLPRLFDRFSRAAVERRSGVRGIGIGLHIAKGLVEAHGGRIWAESDPGHFTKFHFTLPTVSPNTRDSGHTHAA